jgi:hypothetical protein
VTVLAASKEISDAVVASGMEHGAAETYDRLSAWWRGKLGCRRLISLPNWLVLYPPILRSRLG